MYDQNVYSCTGRLGANPSMKYTADGTAVTNFNIAVNYGERTLWLRCECWGGLAENVNQYLTKGSRVAVSGPLRPDSWEDDSGNKRREIRLIARTVTFLDQKESGGEKPAEDIKKTDDEPAVVSNGKWPWS